MEGVNLGGFLLGYLAVLAFGVGSLLAFGLWVARLTRAALLVFASGLLCATLIAALATVSFLQREFHPEGHELLVVVTALTLLLAGAGQFIAALRSPRSYAAAFGCAAGSIVYGVVAGLGGSDALSWELPAGPEVSLLLAGASLLIAALPDHRKTGTLLWAAQALLGGMAGFGVGAACVTTRCTLLGDPGRANHVLVEVRVLGVLVSEETGFVPLPEGGPSSIRAVSLGQAAWVHGPPVVGAAAGIIAALGIAALLVRRSGEHVAAKPLTSVDWPRGHNSSGDQVKPAGAG